MARSNRRCNTNLSLGTLILAVSAIFFSSCNSDSEGLTKFRLSDEPKSGISIYGQTQGTTYAILCSDKVSFSKREIDQILKRFDGALSTYIPNSIISKFNSAPAGAFEYVDTFGYFNDCIQMSQSIYNETNGAFDPSVFPLLENWGFLSKITDVPDSVVISNTLKKTGFKLNYHYSFMPNEVDTLLSTIVKRTPGFKLVFNAIAQGQAVDVLCEYLEKRGAKNYFVEIGGEVRVKGVNSKDEIWTIGIDKPIENSTAANRELINIIQLQDKAVATSGNYRQFYEKNGVKYSHTLNPKTGYPVRHKLLSATVVASSCALADAYATAFMVLGVDQTKTFLEQEMNLNLEVFLIYNNESGKIETFSSRGFKNIIK